MRTTNVTKSQQVASLRSRLNTAKQALATLRMSIADFQTTIEELTVLIDQEEVRSGKRDPSASDYPLLIRSSRTRLENCKTSLENLRVQETLKEEEIQNLETELKLAESRQARAKRKHRSTAA